MLNCKLHICCHAPSILFCFCFFVVVVYYTGREETLMAFKKHFDHQLELYKSVVSVSAPWLAQLVGYQTVVRKVEGLSPGWTNTQDVKN